MGILWLDELRQQDVPVAGGKAANLAELTRRGLPVPNGFVVTAPAYVDHARRLELESKLSPLVQRHDWGAVEATAAELIGCQPLDSGLEAATRTALRRLGAEAVAVRSSATAEDLEEASFAGQQSSVLDVRGEDAVLAAVRRCWASLWTRRALHYREQRGFDHFSVQMAVLVQQMLAPDAAGVVFTRDPVSSDGDRLLIEVTRGLGEGVVSGELSGERYLVERAGLRVDEQPGDRRALNPRQVEQVCRVALAVEEHLGQPQDIEFAVSGERVFLLQARPITAARPSSELVPPLRKPGYIDRKMEPIANERYAVAPRPLDNLTFTLLVGGVIHALRQGGAEISAQDEAAFRAQVWRPAYRLPPVRLGWRALGYAGHCVRLLKRDWQAWWDAGPRQTLRDVSAAVDLQALSDAELLERAERIAAAWEGPLNTRFEAAGAIEAETWLGLLVALAVGPRERHQVVAHLLTGLENPTLEVNEALWQLSRLARRDPHVRAGVREMAEERLEQTPEGWAFLRELHRFLDLYGHREGTCYYLSTPTWRRDPKPVWRLLGVLVEADSMPGDPTAVQACHAGERDRVQRRLRFYPGLGRAFRFLVDRLRALHAFRESSHFDLTYPLDALQQVAFEWGRRLRSRGVLGVVDDVYYLTHDEVREWLLERAPPSAEARRLIARRRATYAEVNARWQAERSRMPGPGLEARGVAVSPGVVQAAARVVHGEHEFHRLQPGEVLVCSYTNPAWTPLFTTAAAVVTETGGAASHAAIVAREYGIPAVMAVPGATRLFVDGTDLLVDGSRGVVTQM